MASAQYCPNMSRSSSPRSPRIAWKRSKASPASVVARSPMRSFAPSLSQFDLRAALARAASAWARKRQGEDTPPLTLESRRLYILPTRRGLMAGALLLLMLLAGLNYNNSLALLLCFTLTGFTLVSMYDCHRTLAGVHLVRALA